MRDFDIASRRGAVRGGGGFSAPMLPGGAPVPGGGPFLPATEAVPPPELYMPPSGQSLVAQGTALNVVTAAGWVELGAFQVPTGSIGVIRMVVVAAAPWTLTSAVEWRVVLGGNPAPGWEAITIPLAPAAAIAREFPPDSVLIRIPDGRRVAVQARVLPADAGNYQLQGELRGWYWGSTP